MSPSVGRWHEQRQLKPHAAWSIGVKQFFNSSAMQRGMWLGLCAPGGPWVDCAPCAAAALRGDTRQDNRYALKRLSTLSNSRIPIRVVHGVVRAATTRTRARPPPTLPNVRARERLPAAAVAPGGDSIRHRHRRRSKGDKPQTGSSRALLLAGVHLPRAREGRRPPPDRRQCHP